MISLQFKSSNKIKVANLKSEFKSLTISENFSEPVLEVSTDELPGLLIYLRDFIYFY